MLMPAWCYQQKDRIIYPEKENFIVLSLYSACIQTLQKKSVAAGLSILSILLPVSNSGQPAMFQGTH